MNRIQDKHELVLFDGVCNLCNSTVDFIIRNDRRDNFRIGALQDENVKNILKSYDIDKSYLESIVLIKGNNVFYRSTAALKITKKLKGPWPLLYTLIIIPRAVRDPIYDWIVKNRYKWFGKRETCRIPTSEEKAKFLGENKGKKSPSILDATNIS